ncbi:MAG: arginase [Pseudobacteriovorax sp.]|nr:arginase [Pseudobacteriovorax sp.]
MSFAKKIEIIGVPSDLGANMRGANMGPAALRIADLKEKVEIQGYEVIDSGDLHVPVRDSLDPKIQDEKFLQPLVKICDELATRTYQSVKENRFPLVIGGDHSIAIGSISGVANHFRDHDQSIGVIWVDAHADINTPDSSPSGNIHGMPLATLLGNGHPELTRIGGEGAKINPKNVALIGIRTIDDHEKMQLKESGIHYYTMRDIDEKGMFHIMQEAIKHVSEGTSGIHVSFDIDGIDPRYAPGVSTPVSGGITFREAHLILEMAYESGKMSSLDFVELNPYTDVGAQSANLTVDLILSALGKSIV